MNAKRKLRRQRIYIGASLIIGFASIFHPIFFLFIIPLLLSLLWEQNKKKLLLYIFIILILSSIPAMVINKKYDISVSNPRITINSLKDFFFDIYNTIKYNLIETDLGNIKTMQEPKLIENFEITDLKNFYLSKEHVDKVKVTLDHKEYYKDNTSLELSLCLPIDSPVLVQKITDYNNWVKYNYVNLWFKSDGFSGMFEFIIIDSDSDWWHYYDKDILEKQSWTLVKMPLKSFNNPPWTQHGNRKQNFDSITKYIIKIVPDEKEKGNHSIHIDEIYLSDI